MRIAFITPSLRMGGYEKVVVNYANELCKRGHNVDILCGRSEGDLLSNVSENVRIIDFNSRARTFVFHLIKYLKKNQVDILYSAFRFYNCVSIIAKRVAKSDVCIYATQHGFESDKKSIITKLYGYFINKADCLIAVADQIAVYETKVLNLKNKNYYTFNNPVFDKRIDLKLEQHPWFEGMHPPIIAMAGRLEKDKGIQYGISILHEILKHKNVNMLILGEGSYRKELEEEADRLGISNNICFLGFVSNPVGYLKQCDLFLHTALAEGFGNVIVEALYAELPVCTTNCSGPLQIIENGKYGICIGSVYDNEFSKNAAQKIINVLEGKVTFEGLKERAMSFDIEESTNQFLEPYYEYIKKN